MSRPNRAAKTLALRLIANNSHDSEIEDSNDEGLSIQEDLVTDKSGRDRGILWIKMLAEARKAPHRSLRGLYEEADGISLFRATMSEKRFVSLKYLFGFDNELRRKVTDKLALIREINLFPCQCL